MIVGSGIDMVEISRIHQSMVRFGQRFLDRIFTGAEQAYCLRKRNAAESLAARFAAKEAGAKALGTGISRGVHWLEIEVVREPGGKPSLRFHGRAGEIAAALSITPPALSRHLRVLRRSGLIHQRGLEQDARVRIYHLQKKPFDELRGWLEEVETFWAGELAAFSDHVERSKVRGKGSPKR